MKIMERGVHSRQSPEEQNLFYLKGIKEVLSEFASQPQIAKIT